MRIDKTTNRVFVRQSWLKDMMLCPERARLSVVQPKFKTTNDSAAIGTAVHSGIEAILSGADVASGVDVSLSKFKELEQSGVNHTNVNPEHWHGFVVSLTRAWASDIAPKVPLGGQCEVPFAVPTGAVIRGMELWFEGTIDYLHSEGIWDWKTAARKYSTLEKQTQDIQSSIYCYAGNKLGITQEESIFRFGVMVRAKESYGQIVTVNRTKAHSDFVVKQAMSAVELACAMMGEQELPTENRWLINDQHYLCSQRWCPWWSVCKGAHISELDNETGEGNG